MAGGGLFVEVGVMLVEARGRLPHHRTAPHHPPPSAGERAGKLKRHMCLLSDNRVPMCIDVLVCPDCPCGQGRARAPDFAGAPSQDDLLVEQWTVSLVNHKGSDEAEVDGRALVQAVRSQLHFSQLGAWASLGKLPPVCYRLSHPGTPSPAAFIRPPNVHNFPLAKTPRHHAYLKVSVKSLPRMESVPTLECPLHSAPPPSPLSATVTVFKSVFAELGHCLLDPPSRLPPPLLKHGSWRDRRSPSPPSPLRSHRHCRPTELIPTGLVDDRLQSGCQHIGKHHCQDDEPPPVHPPGLEKGCQSGSSCSSMKSLIDGGGFRPPGLADSIINAFRNEVASWRDDSAKGSGGGGSKCSVGRANPLKRKRQELNTHCKKLLSEQADHLASTFNTLNLHTSPPSPQVSKSAQVRRHHLSTLPATPPPPRKSMESHVTDSSSEDTEECESPVTCDRPPTPTPPLQVANIPRRQFSRPLLGNLEESLLNGRVKPESVVGGYTADLGASGTFCPRHLTLPVTVSHFPVMGQSAPYMGVVKLSRKGYHVPRSGTVQVTLLNPLGTVIKMFVVPYDLEDMPPNSHTFLRQRILAASSLRYLIHLRFSSSKSGRVFLHTDLRMIIARQYDTDASMELDIESNCQLRSVVISPSDPKYSSKK